MGMFFAGARGARLRLSVCSVVGASVFAATVLLVALTDSGATVQGGNQGLILANPRERMFVHVRSRLADPDEVSFT
jgi:hypothetical protein